MVNTTESNTRKVPGHRRREDFRQRKVGNNLRELHPLHLCRTQNLILSQMKILGIRLRAASRNKIPGNELTQDRTDSDISDVFKGAKARR